MKSISCRFTFICKTFNLKFLFRSVTCLFLLFDSIFVSGQTSGIITGTVKTSDGKPAQFVTITLSGTTKGTIVKPNGEYIIKNIVPGQYELVASYTGLATQKRQVTVTAGITTTSDFILVESDQQLQEVVVTVDNHKVTNKNTDQVARMPLNNLQNPQAYNVVNSEIIKQQNIVSITNAFSNAPGVTPILYPSGGIAAFSRGFATDVNARNGLQSTAGRASADVANVERIEFLKGPSGTLFGAGISSFGGVVNLVTKQPFDYFQGSVDLSMGSFGLGRVTADINTPLNNDRSLLLRVNTALQRQDSYNERGFYNSALFTPSILYRVNDRFTLLLDAELYSVNSVRPTYVRILPSTGIRSYADIPLDYKKSLFDNDLDAKTNATKFFAEGKYQLNDNWTSTSNVSYVNEFVDHSYQDYPVWVTPDSVTLDVSKYGPVSNTYINIQQNFNGKFNTGVIKHNFLLGANITQYNGRGMSGSTGVIRKYSIHDKNPKIDRALVDSALVPGTIMNWGNTNNTTYGAYASDVLNLRDRLFLMLSLRYEYIDDKSTGIWASPYTQSSWSPKLGLVYQPVKDHISLFANYMNGYQNNPPATQPDGSRFTIKPVYAVQYEGGAKFELLGKKVNSTISYYYIDIDNAVRYNDLGFAFQDGKQVSKGIEWDFTANPVEGLTLLLGYGYNDNRIKGSQNLDNNISNNSPQHIANYWLNYHFKQGALKNFGLGAGGNYVGKSYFDDSNIFLLPSYHILNASAFYEDTKFRIAFKMNNIGDQKSWGFWGAPNPTRNFLATLTMKF
ncbi:TonB-dependent receptor [Pararcticibacter amylolyticus]|uniref:TonB-dependent siderophore receptor n=1 Tax=Pararcticibacter amylolyticus TaxID=2173175 RepID=A0A2U2PCZ7_9SPHI|nr:TonB-dependent receptor [Pararcticibacter amylolyticus]PWG79230.1 TonB-dependent siderophore receptor [Pararcticibacter amylolyticus]